MDAEDGKLLVKIARTVIENHVRHGRTGVPKNYPKEFDQKSGVFTTIHEYPDKDLRGCIGFPEPEMPLINALIESAVSACHDPRFRPLAEEELDKIVIEVSVLTKPELMRVTDPSEYPSRIRIGRDGLIIEFGYNRGLLLPQVPVEWKWGPLEFLKNLCTKAGLSEDDWERDGVKIYRFSSHIFSEEKPYGPISGR